MGQFSYIHNKRQLNYNLSKKEILNKKYLTALTELSKSILKPSQVFNTRVEYDLSNHISMKSYLSTKIVPTKTAFDYLGQLTDLLTLLADNKIKGEYIVPSLDFVFLKDGQVYLTVLPASELPQLTHMTNIFIEFTEVWQPENDSGMDVKNRFRGIAEKQETAVLQNIREFIEKYRPNHKKPTKTKSEYVKSEPQPADQPLNEPREPITTDNKEVNITPEVIPVPQKEPTVLELTPGSSEDTDEAIEPSPTALPITDSTTLLVTQPTKPVATHGKQISEVLLTSLTLPEPIVFKLAQGIYSIGKSQTTDIQIKEPTLSRRHAELEITETQVIIRDLGSTNGTRINGTKVTEQQLKNTDKLTFAATDFKVEIKEV